MEQEEKELPVDKIGKEKSDLDDKTHSGRSVLPNRSVRFLGTSVNSVPEKIGTDRFHKKFGTDVIRYRFFRFGSGIYRKNRTSM